jgi:hypothetical protein
MRTGELIMSEKDVKEARDSYERRRELDEQNATGQR